MAARCTWGVVLATLAVTAASVILAGAVIIYAGLFNVAATEPHWPVTHWLFETARTRSIAAHARGIIGPPGLDNAANITKGTEHFAAHCAVCHGAPGVPKGGIAQGLYPPPPDLAIAARHYSDAELFWIIKHGIKMTGMPGWADHSDAELWATVAFLKKLGAGMSEQEYGELVKTNLMHGMKHQPESAAGAPPPAGHKHH
jgi:mono/diheme cytochrome c family protein